MKPGAILEIFERGAFLKILKIGLEKCIKIRQKSRFFRARARNRRIFFTSLAHKARLLEKFFAVFGGLRCKEKGVFEKPRFGSPKRGGGGGRCLESPLHEAEQVLGLDWIYL